MVNAQPGLFALSLYLWRVVADERDKQKWNLPLMVYYNGSYNTRNWFHVKYNDLKERDVIISSLSIILISSIIILLSSLNFYRIYSINNLKDDEKIIFTINNIDNNFQ